MTDQIKIEMHYFENKKGTDDGSFFYFILNFLMLQQIRNFSVKIFNTVSKIINFTLNLILCRKLFQFCKVCIEELNLTQLHFLAVLFLAPLYSVLSFRNPYLLSYTLAALFPRQNNSINFFMN